MESDDSPEIPDRGKTSDIQGLPSEGGGVEVREGGGAMEERSCLDSVVYCKTASDRFIRQ